MKRRFTVLIFIQILLLPVGVYLHAQTLDSVTASIDSTNTGPNDSLKVSGDSSRAKLLKSLKESSDLKTVVTYKAADSIVFDMDSMKLFLYNKSEVNYEKITLEADSVAVDLDLNTVHAAGMRDSTGEIAGKPVFKDGEQPYNSENMSYNFKTQKGVVKHARTKQGEEYLLTEVAKMNGKDEKGNDIVYVKNGKFTSCEAEEPHYYIKSRKLKVIPRKKIISGPLFLVVEGFTLPVVLPFGYFPNQEGKRSGVIMPEYGEAADRGFFLRNGGFYWAVNDYLGLEFKGDIFTKGGWRLDVGARYKLRYRLDGNLNVAYGLRKFGEKTDLDFSGDRTFQLTWNHNQIINPSTSLKANVQLGTSNYLQVNSFEAQDILTTNLASSITFNKNFSGTPYNLNITLKHDQNNQSRIMNLSLPEILLSRSRTFPFRKLLSGKKSRLWDALENLGYNYNFNFVNKISSKDSLLGDILLHPTRDVTLNTYNTNGELTASDTRKGFTYYRAGIRQSVPISTKIPIWKINISPNFRYNEYWYFNKISKSYREELDSLEYEVGEGFDGYSDYQAKTVTEVSRRGIVEKDTTYGFFTARDFNFNVNASTVLYGFYQATKSKRQVAVRHTLTPTVGYSYQPDFGDPKWKIYETVQKDTTGETETYSRFENAVFRPQGRGESQSINFSLGNRLDLKFLRKVADGDTIDPKDRYNKIVLLDNASISGNYNFAADSLNLSVLRVNARTSIFENKVNIQMNGSLDPYEVNDFGRRINTFLFDSQRKLVRLSSLTFAVSTGLRPKKGKKGAKGSKGVKMEAPMRDDIMLYRQQYADFSVPWSLNATYSLTYTNNGIKKDTIQTLQFNGEVNLTPKWKLTASSGFDIENRKFTFTKLTIYRDLHCWEMSLNWVPFGDRRSFVFTLNVKNPTLKDLKVTRRSDARDRAGVF